VAGTYRFWSHDALDTYGYLYKHDFNPAQPSSNRLVSDDNSCSEGQFLFSQPLQLQIKYILVVTTPSPAMTGTFSIVTIGPARVDFTDLGEWPHQRWMTSAQLNLDL
jgi:hypothetical protein